MTKSPSAGRTIWTMVSAYAAHGSSGGRRDTAGHPTSGSREYGAVPAAPSRLPLPTLLSQVLVAHTIEFDNLAELRLPHHTSGDDRDAGSDTPWLVSYVCWANVLEYVGTDGLTVGALGAQARTDRLLLEGLRRWRYLRLIPPAGKALTKPFPAATQVRTTRHGRRAQDIWRALPPVMDERWRGRFGADAVERLHQALAAIFARLPIDPPAFLPVVYPTQNGKAAAAAPGPPRHRLGPGTVDLVTLLAGVLLSFTLDFEADAKVSLPISANTLRVLDREPRRLPRPPPPDRHLQGGQRHVHRVLGAPGLRGARARPGRDAGQGHPPHRQGRRRPGQVRTSPGRDRG